MAANLANHLWQSTLFVAAVWVCSLLIQRNRADVRHALWLSASLKFLVPFGALVALGRLFPLGEAHVPDALTVTSIAQRLSLGEIEPKIFLISRQAASVPLRRARSRGRSSCCSASGSLGRSGSRRAGSRSGGASSPSCAARTSSSRDASTRCYGEPRSQALRSGGST